MKLFEQIADKNIRWHLLRLVRVTYERFPPVQVNILLAALSLDGVEQELLEAYYTDDKYSSAPDMDDSLLTG
jgi:hypothetical protein